MLAKLFDLSSHEKTEAIDTIIDDISVKPEHIIMNLVAVMVAVVGIYQNSTPILIASMILAQWLYPLVGMSLGMTMRSWKVFLYAGRNLALNVGIALVAGSIVTWIVRGIGSLDNSPYNLSDISYLQTQPAYAMVGLAGFLGGIAAGYMLSHPSVDNKLSGIAIAASLVPPFAGAVVNLSYLDWVGFGSYMLIVVTTIVTVIAGSGVMLGLMNFEYYGDEAEEQVDEEKAEEENS